MDGKIVFPDLFDRNSGSEYILGGFIMNTKIMENTIGLIDEKDLENLAVSGGNDVQAMATPTILTSTTGCAGAITAVSISITTWISDQFNC